MNQKTAKPLLNRILARVSKCFDQETVKKLAVLRLDEASTAMIERLAEKSTEGTLTPEERDEYLAIVSVMDFVGILQIQARRRLETRRRATVS